MELVFGITDKLHVSVLPSVEVRLCFVNMVLATNVFPSAFSSFSSTKSAILAILYRWHLHHAL